MTNQIDPNMIHGMLGNLNKCCIHPDIKMYDHVGSSKTTLKCLNCGQASEGYTLVDVVRTWQNHFSTPQYSTSQTPQNDINTWQQSRYIDPKYRGMGFIQSVDTVYEESKNVVSDQRARPICRCDDPGGSEWIAKRLNMAAMFEKFANDYASKNPGSNAILDYIKDYT